MSKQFPVDTNLSEWLVSNLAEPTVELFNQVRWMLSETDEHRQLLHLKGEVDFELNQVLLNLRPGHSCIAYRLAWKFPDEEDFVFFLILNQDMRITKIVKSAAPEGRPVSIH